MLDQEIIDDYSKQVDEYSEAMTIILDSLDTDTCQNELYEKFGQNADRIYGAVSMLDLKLFSEYSLKMKEMTYKCLHVENFEPFSKCLEIMKNYIPLLKKTPAFLENTEGIKEFEFECKRETGRIERVLNSQLHNIKDGSIACEDNSSLIYVYDKSSIIETDVKAAKKVYYPTPKFFNAMSGFNKEFLVNQLSIYGIIINVGVCEDWGDLLKEVRITNPMIPIILTARQKNMLSKLNKEKLGVQAIMTSSYKFEKYLDKFKAIYKKTEKETTTNNQEPNNFLGDFKSVSATLFQKDLPSPFDVYIKLGEKKFTRIFKKEESFDTNQIEKHIEKGVECYYISSVDHDQYIQKMDEEISRIFDDEKINLSDKKDKFIEYASDVCNYMEELEVDEENLDKAKKFVENSEKFIEDVSKDEDAIKDFLSDIRNIEHIASVTLMMGLFLNKIKVNTEIYNDISMTCLLHDIGLKNAPTVVKEQIAEDMNEEELRVFYAHPKEGARTLAKLGFKPALVEAVSQHHMRYDGSGFPKGSKKNSNLNRIAELIGLVEDFLVVIKATTEGTDPAKEFQTNHFEKFSKKMRNIFKLLFIK